MRGRTFLPSFVAVALALWFVMRLPCCLRAPAPLCRTSGARVACVARPPAPSGAQSARLAACTTALPSLAPPRPNLYRYVLKHSCCLNHFAVLLAVSLFFTTFVIPTRRYRQIIVKFTLNENRNYRFHQTNE